MIIFKLYYLPQYLYILLLNEPRIYIDFCDYNIFSGATLAIGNCVCDGVWSVMPGMDPWDR